MRGIRLAKDSRPEELPWRSTGRRPAGRSRGRCASGRARRPQTHVAKEVERGETSRVRSTSQHAGREYSLTPAQPGHTIQRSLAVRFTRGVLARHETKDSCRGSGLRDGRSRTAPGPVPGADTGRRSYVQQGRGADFLQELHELSSFWRDRPDGPRDLSGCAAVGALDRGESGLGHDAAVARRSGSWRLRQ